IGMNQDIWKYDTILDKWTKKTNYPGVPIYGVYGFVLGSYIYCGVGVDASATYYQAFWKYNTSIDSWSKEADYIGAARSTCSSFAIADSGYLGLGVDKAGNYYNDFYKFFPDSNTGINNLTTTSGIVISPN